MKLNKGYIYLLAAAISYASTGILARILSADLSALWQVFLRLAVSSGIAWIYLLIRNKKKSLNNPKNWPITIFMGVIAYASSVIAFTYAVEHAPIGNVFFVFSSYPVITTFLAFYLLHEKINRKHIFALVIMCVGLLLLFNPSYLSQYFVGNILSVYVGVTFALYALISRYLNNHGEDPATFTFLSITIGTITSFITILLFDFTPQSIDLTTIIVITIYGFINYIAHLLVNLGFNFVSASIGTMILLLEAVFATIFALVFFAEIPTLLFICGAFLILSAVYISVRQ